MPSTRKGSALMFALIVLFLLLTSGIDFVHGSSTTKDSKKKAKKSAENESSDKPNEQSQCFWSPHLKKWRSLHLQDGVPTLNDDLDELNCAALSTNPGNGGNEDPNLDLLLLLQLFPIEEIEQLLEELASAKKRLPALQNLASLNGNNQGNKKPVIPQNLLKNLNLEDFAALHDVSANTFLEMVHKAHAEATQLANAQANPPVEPARVEPTPLADTEFEQIPKESLEDFKEENNLYHQVLSSLKFLFNGFIVYLFWNGIGRFMHWISGTSEDESKNSSQNQIKNSNGKQEEGSGDSLIMIETPKGPIFIDPQKLLDFKPNKAEQNSKQNSQKTETKRNKNQTKEKQKLAIMPWRKCGWKNCNKMDVWQSTKKFKVCGQCMMVRYCCKQHQILDWKEGNHRLVCTLAPRKIPRYLIPSGGVGVAAINK